MGKSAERALKIILTLFKDQYQPHLILELGKLGAIAIYYLLFTLVPWVLQGAIPFLLTTFKPKFVYLIVMVGTAALLTSVYNLVMYFVYTLEIPFLEQYRISPNVAINKCRNPGLGNRALNNGLKL